MKPNRASHKKGFLPGILGILVAFSICFVSGAWAGSPGTSTANFLKIGMGARGQAMGGAQSAISNDVNASYWNPAGLTQMRFQEVGLMYYQMVENVRYQYATYARPVQDKGVFTAGINYLDYGSIQGYDASGPTSNLKASNLLFTGGWAQRLMKNESFYGGFNFKYLQSDLAGYSASAPMLDGGLLYKFENGRVRGLNLAAVFRNVGPSVTYESDGAPLPRQFVLGSGYTTLGGKLNLDLDYTLPNDSNNYFSAGVEYNVIDMLALRAGYNGQSQFVGTGLSAGIGLRFNQWNIDYAFVPYGEFGNTNMISIGVRFGHALNVKDAGDQIESNYARALRLYNSGQAVESYSVVCDILRIAPWHTPSVELKAKIEKEFQEMAVSKNRAQLDTQIANEFAAAKTAFDHDELIVAKKGFETILALDPTHVGSKVYLERIQNRYDSLAQESFKQGMDYFAAGDYAKAKAMFEKTLTIDENNKDAQAQLQTTKEVMADSSKRAEEMAKLAGAAGAYKEGLAAYQKNDLETALQKFEEAQTLAPSYEEVGRYLSVTKVTLANILFDEASVDLDNGSLETAATKLKRAAALNPKDTRVKPLLDVALRDLNSKHQLDSRNAYQEGLNAYLSGQNDRAAELWKKAIDLDPSNEDAKQALSKLSEQQNHEKSDGDR